MQGVMKIGTIQKYKQRHRVKKRRSQTVEKILKEKVNYFFTLINPYVK